MTAISFKKVTEGSEKKYSSQRTMTESLHDSMRCDNTRTRPKRTQCRKSGISFTQGIKKLNMEQNGVEYGRKNDRLQYRNLRKERTRTKHMHTKDTQAQIYTLQENKYKKNENPQVTCPMSSNPSRHPSRPPFSRQIEPRCKNKIKLKPRSASFDFSLPRSTHLLLCPLGFLALRSFSGASGFHTFKAHSSISLFLSSVHPMSFASSSSSLGSSSSPYSMRFGFCGRDAAMFRERLGLY